MRYVSIIGPGEAGEREAADAFELGRLCGERGWTVVTGGLGGVMDEAARGAAEAGGLSVGILPGWDRVGASPHLTVAIPTGMGELRNGLVVRSGEAVIACGGSWGTLSEIALAVKTGKPVVGLRTWELEDPAGAEPKVRLADSPLAAVELVERLLPAAD